MANGTDTIIIRGGSAEVDFDPAVYPSDPSNPRRHNNTNPARKVTRVVISGDITFDSGNVPSGLTCEITVDVR